MNTKAIERVDRIMTQAVLSVDVAEPAANVLRLFAGYPIHHLPVLSEQKVVGMLSSADVMKLQALLPRTGAAGDEFLNQRMSIARLMRAPVVTIQPQQSIADAASLMASHAIHALPVVDRQQRLLGIVTTTDVMHAALAPEASPEAAAAGDNTDKLRDPRLSPAEFEQAISAARTAVAAGKDPQSIALALLYLQRRVAPLEHVLRTADRYLSSGQDNALHTALLKDIRAAKLGSPGPTEGTTPFGLVVG